jgi:hypothetical protein
VDRVYPWRAARSAVPVVSCQWSELTEETDRRGRRCGEQHSSGHMLVFTALFSPCDLGFLGYSLQIYFLHFLL